MASLTALKREVSNWEDVTRVEIERQRNGDVALEVRAESDLIHELDDLCERFDDAVFQPVGKFFGEYEYVVC